MKAIMRYWSVGMLVVALGLTGAGFAGCHTTEGAGRDIQEIGEGTEEAAQEVGEETYYDDRSRRY